MAGRVRRQTAWVVPCRRVVGATARLISISLVRSPQAEPFRLVAETPQPDCATAWRHLLKRMSVRLRQVFGFRSCLSCGRTSQLPIALNPSADLRGVVVVRSLLIQCRVSPLRRQRPRWYSGFRGSSVSLVRWPLFHDRRPHRPRIRRRRHLRLWASWKPWKLWRRVFRNLRMTCQRRSKS